MRSLDPRLFIRASSNQDTRQQLPLFPYNYTDQYRDMTVLSFFEEGYKTNSIVFSLVSMRADAVKRAPLVLFDVNKPDEPIPYDEKIPLYKLLYNPNPYFEHGEMFAITETYRILGGDAYWWAQRNNRGMIEQLIPYHSACITPKATPDNWIDHYTYDNGSGFKKDLPKEDIIQFRWPSYDPKKPFRSVSPLIAGAKEIDIDNFRAELDRASLKMGIAPSYVVFAGPDQATLDQNTANLLSEQIQMRFGNKNVSRAALMPYGSSIQKLGFNAAEMSTEIFSKIPETRLCQLLRVPIMMLSFLASADVKTYANFQEANKQFYKEIENAWIAYANALTKYFKNETFAGDNRQYIIKFDVSTIDELHDSVDLTQDRAMNQFTKDAMSLNEFREQLGLPPFPDQTIGVLLYSQIVALQKAGSNINPTENQSN